MSRVFDKDEDPPLIGPGEVYFHKRTPNMRLAVPGRVGPPCGDPDWFLRGMPYLPDAPPVVRDKNGFPTCCGALEIPTGVSVNGGSGVIYTPPTGPPPPVSVLARPNCFFWVGTEIPAPWSVTVTNIPQPNEEVVFGGLTVGNNYRITIFDGAGQFVAMWNGPDCSSMTLIHFFVAMPYEFDWVQVGGPLVQLRFGPNSGFPPFSLWIREI